MKVYPSEIVIVANSKGFLPSPSFLFLSLGKTIGKVNQTKNEVALLESENSYKIDFRRFLYHVDCLW